jgi:hypothetical protein
VVEIRPHLRGDAGDLYGLVPIQQQIVVIEHVVTLFGGDISPDALNAQLIAAEAARPTEHPDALDYILRGRAAAGKGWRPA